MTTRGANYPRRPNDDYPTPEPAIVALFGHVLLGPIIFDPACGRLKRVVRVAERMGYVGVGADIIWGDDFLADEQDYQCSVVTNPPFGDRRGSMTLAFIEHALERTRRHKQKVAMLLPVDFDSGKTRAHVFGDCDAFSLKLVLLDRLKWFNDQAGSLNHAWFVWDWKHQGAPVLRYARAVMTVSGMRKKLDAA